jgi:hypothetical protein
MEAVLPNFGDANHRPFVSPTARAWFWRITFVVLALGTVYGMFLHTLAEEMLFQSSSIASENKALRAERPALIAKAERLRLAENSLKAEITRKSELGVLYEREKAARLQAQRDLGAALDRLKALESTRAKKR